MAANDDPAARPATEPQEGRSGVAAALRIDFSQLRGSVLAEPVSRLLADVPDWKALLEGSGVVPVRDLDVVNLYSPDLSRVRTVVAGSYATPGLGELAARRLATRRGRSVRFEPRGELRVAPWESEDDTARIVALGGERSFFISRPEDLVAAVAQREVSERTDAGVGAAWWAGAGEDALWLRAEGLSVIARGEAREMAPAELVLRVTLAEDGAVGITMEGRFGNEAAARAAQAFWEGKRRQGAGNPAFAFIGLAAPLRRLRIDRDGDLVTAHTALPAAEVRGLIELAKGRVGAPLKAPPMPPLPPRAPVR